MPFLSIDLLGFAAPPTLGGDPTSRGFTATEARALAGAFPTSVGVGLSASFLGNLTPSLQRMCLRYASGNPDGLPPTFTIGGDAIVDRGEFCAGFVLANPVTEVQRVSFIGDLIGGIGDGLKSAVTTIGGLANDVITVLPTVAKTIATGAQAVQQIQTAIRGPMTERAMIAINPNTGMPYTQSELEFISFCTADPEGCDRLIASNSGFFPASFGGEAAMTMPINPSTGSPMIQMAGVGSALSTLARQALMNPQVAAGLRALGFGALVGAGEAGVQALIGGVSGGGAASASGASGPLLMDYPAGTRYPRSIVLRAPDKPEKRYRSEGVAILRSGDIAAVRRVQKAASRARKGRRRSYSARPVLQIGGGNGVHHVCGSCLSAPCQCKG